MSTRSIGTDQGYLASDHVICVPMGEYRIAAAPGFLFTRDLGSCVGVSLYYPRLRLGAMIHVAFPGSGAGSDQPSAHADTAMRAVLGGFERRGACRSFVEVKLAGGGNMFGFEVCPSMDVGARNIEFVRQCLQQEQLRIGAEDLGTTHPTTMRLDLSNGHVHLSTSGKVYRVM